MAVVLALGNWEHQGHQAASGTGASPCSTFADKHQATDARTRIFNPGHEILGQGQELRGAAALPGSRFPLNYDSEEPYAILLPHLAALKGCAVVLRLRAPAELEAGKSEPALADISLALRLTEKIRSEPFLISQLVRIAMLQITAQAVWEGLAQHRWTDAQLSELDQQLAALDFVADYQTAMRAEIAWQAAETDVLRHHPNQLCNMEFYDFGEGGSTRLPDLPGHLIPPGWFYQNELRSSQFILEQLLPIGDVRQQTISPTLVKQADEALPTMRRTPYSMLAKMFLFGLENSPSKFALAQTTVNLSRTACALERFRLAHGKYPETLDALAPQFIAEVPHDPIGGQPLHHRPTDDGQFNLYSEGWNKKDDGGIVSLTKGGSVDSENGDWVWRYSNDRLMDRAFEGAPFSRFTRVPSPPKASHVSLPHQLNFGVKTEA